MKATIVWHGSVGNGDPREIYRFRFVLDAGDGTPPYTETISLRTARVLAAQIEDGNAFIVMLRKITGTPIAGYDSLVGLSFCDDFQPLDQNLNTSNRDKT